MMQSKAGVECHCAWPLEAHWLVLETPHVVVHLIVYQGGDVGLHGHVFRHLMLVKALAWDRRLTPTRLALRP